MFLESSSQPETTTGRSCSRSRAKNCSTFKRLRSQLRSAWCNLRSRFVFSFRKNCKRNKHSARVAAKNMFWMFATFSRSRAKSKQQSMFMKLRSQLSSVRSDVQRCQFPEVKVESAATTADYVANHICWMFTNTLLCQSPDFLGYRANNKTTTRKF